MSYLKSLFSLDNKISIVTGSARGNGKAIAEALLRSGSIVIMVDVLKMELLQTEKKFLSENLPAVSYVCDITKKDQILKLGKYIGKKFGKLDILVNNAGITRDNLSIRMSDEDWDDVINVNLTASFLLSRDCLKVMLKKRWGRIINITAVVGVMGNAGQSNYAASKAGMIGMTKSIASEVSSRGITVNCISPGYVVTAMTDKISDAAKENILQNTPVGRFGKAEEIADWAIYLASNEADYITGQNININGGLVMV
jgi:3-oxoacyl-[acyl-carrier protein] reductase